MAKQRRRVGKRVLWVIACCTAWITGQWAWQSKPFHLQDRFFPRQLAEVYPGFLYRSGQIAPNLIEQTLDDLGIDVIVDLSGDRGDRAQEVEREVAARRGVAYHSFALRGNGTGAVDEYVGAIEAIARAEAAGERVLVHCRAGDRRTGGVLSAYQMLVRGESRARATAELGRFAPRSFWRQQWAALRKGRFAELGVSHEMPPRQAALLAYVDGNLEEIARGLDERGVKPSAPLHPSVAGASPGLTLARRK